MTNIQIDEFSTGIKFQGTNNNWVFTDYTNQYMNSTIKDIPVAVKKAISNKEFSLTKEVFQENPAILGKEFSSQEYECSIIAVITSGKDEQGNPNPVTRYFLCSGLGNLSKLIYWYFTEAGKPVFNPFDYPKSTEYYLYEDHERSELISDKYIKYLSEEPPIILDSDIVCDPILIDTIANNIFIKNNFISWAYNVEGLENPHNFQVIYPANANAERIILQRLNRNNSNKNTKSIPDERSIIIAIQGLITVSKFDIKHLQHLEKVLNPFLFSISDEELNKIFDQLGAQYIYSHKSYTANNIKLLVLQAIILPEMLPKFLNWICDINDKNDGKKVLKLFQHNIIKRIKNLDRSPLFNRIKEGVNILIVNLINNPKSLEISINLLSDEEGIWGRVYQEFTRKALISDLENINRKNINTNQSFLVLSNKGWLNIIDEIKSPWNSHNFKLETKYLTLGKLFAILAKSQANSLINNYDYKLSAFFYHLAQHQVPRNIFKGTKLQKDNAFLFGTLRIYREKGILEKIISLLIYWKIEIPVIPLVSSLILLGITTYYLGLNREKINNSDLLPTPNSFPTSTPIPTPTPISSASTPTPNSSNAIPTPIPTPTPTSIPIQIESIPDNIKAIGIRDFNNTKTSIEKIKNETIRYLNADSSNVIPEILAPGLNLSLDTLDQDKEKWIQAIWNYQNNVIKTVKPDGIIDINRTTYKYFRCNLFERMDLIDKVSFPTVRECRNLGFKSQENFTSNPNNNSFELTTGIKTRAIAGFNRTKASIEKIKNETIKYLKSDPSDAIPEILAPDLNLSLDTLDQDKEKWVQEIWNYQNNVIKTVKPDGIIDIDRTTYKYFRCNLFERMDLIDKISSPTVRECKNLGFKFE